ncbi:protein TPX2 isoform X2 [Mangifera indica]|uniref:protein TPX2 isoform X2 n=1 Tax=Mangifera indica TaxID=29780 RepID=UPI001CFAA6C2|nr:protein TPX2 isoform X2 [Mangifera indica]
MSVAEEPTKMVIIDEAYEFSAPRFFDFIRGETDEEMQKAELWFDKALSYAPSPFMPRIKTDRFLKVDSLCNFSEAADQIQKASESSDSNATNCHSELEQQPELISAVTIEVEVTPTEEKGENNGDLVNVVSAAQDVCEDVAGTVSLQENGRTACSSVNTEPANDKEKSKSSVQVGPEYCTPKPVMPSQKEAIDSKKKQTAKKIASIIKNSSAVKPKNQLQSAQAKRDTNAKNVAGTPSLVLENQAIKRQKLDGGRSRQILNVKPPILPHKSKLGLTSSSSSFCTSVANKSNKDDRKVYVREREPVAPFVSMAEMMKKFNSSTRDLSLPHVHRKATLTLTRPKEPELETSQRVRSVKVKSTAELEEEMMAKIPKFKARPLNKKILEAPTLPAPPRSIPRPREFQEFHLETTARANQNAETSSVASTEVSLQKQWKPSLTEPKSPALHTLLRARPPTVKSSAELELEELEKAPKFKARPVNRKIFESKGELGMFCNAKKHVTKPQEFHFSINERITPAVAVVDMFDKLSLNSEPRYDKPIPRNTKPNPFHLYTEERGAEKERRFVVEVVHKQLEEERAKIPKATPYPYTTDYPVIPPKPEPKQCTKPEPFQLESLVRHEEEMQREMEERKRKEKEEAQMRMFKAQPFLKEDPIPIPEKVRKPLTEVKGFNLHLEHRAVERAEFDQKVKEKEMMYKRYREESEAARMMEEEKALKQLRRTLVPHARPVPNFNQPFCPQKSLKESTKPKSPKLRVVQRKERRKMLLASVNSSATAHR